MVLWYVPPYYTEQTLKLAFVIKRPLILEFCSLNFIVIIKTSYYSVCVCSYIKSKLECTNLLYIGTKIYKPKILQRVAYFVRNKILMKLRTLCTHNQQLWKRVKSVLLAKRMFQVSHPVKTYCYKGYTVLRKLKLYTEHHENV